ncbi:16S rRNA (adenine(1518)-N(6)/adenine(1519)-N(6))-dimethyltransferase RsmA [Candidatus Amarolinea dominans]|uniref:16S rRNA (adenine(1518)-N(6)/adenine(1519)-N(6))- dimethyltransferase RsmA n=1 Tax=Candidatus Amarolinea dominans TaxID=3140696 RepID=UPI0031CC3EBB
MANTLVQQLRAAGIEPRKALGQHFLVDETHLARIAAAADLSAADSVLEIGPGPGPLTHLLAAQAGRVVAVETDGRLIAFLQQTFAAQPHVHIIHQDILQFDPCALMQPQYKVVANVPYYITSAILRHLLESACPPALTVVTVQREVAQRVVARPPDMSLLAVSVQLFCEVEIVGKIPAGAFYPPPQVDSAILRLRRRTSLAADLVLANVPAFFDVVRAGFGQKRKQLHNSLAAGLGQTPGAIAAALSQAGLDGKRRAETLTLAEWGLLWRALSGDWGEAIESRAS